LRVTEPTVFPSTTSGTGKSVIKVPGVGLAAWRITPINKKTTPSREMWGKTSLFDLKMYMSGSDLFSGNQTSPNWLRKSYKGLSQLIWRDTQQREPICQYETSSGFVRGQVKAREVSFFARVRFGQRSD
jgi:hypothetical protein